MTTTKEKEQIIKELLSLWCTVPQMRLGQLLENYVFKDGKRGDSTSCKLYYQRDDTTLENIKKAKEGKKNGKLI